MLNSERQAHIKAALSTAAEPLSASSFARRFTVSRQTIVGDIALLRAQGEPIIATPRGYTLSQPAALYGQLRGQLNIRTVADMKLFLSRVARYHGHLLSELTGGIHLHTISVKQKSDIAKIKMALHQAGILYEQLEEAADQG